MRAWFFLLRFSLILTATMLSAMETNPAAQSSDNFVPVTDTMLQNPSPDNWPMWRHTLNGWGYSPLEQ
ncbi:uncharacterized protein METZ01_LOCUS435852, partial [marine metagenome]